MKFRPWVHADMPPQMAPGHDMREYIVRDDERGAPGVAKDSKTLGSAYDQFLQRTVVFDSIETFPFPVWPVCIVAEMHTYLCPLFTFPSVFGSEGSSIIHCWGSYCACWGFFGKGHSYGRPVYVRPPWTYSSRRSIKWPRCWI